MNPLKFTRADIFEFRQGLLDAGFKPENIVLLHDDPALLKNTRFLAVAANIREELTLLAGGLSQDDSLIVAFTGHGIQFKGEKESYFCPRDARLSRRDSLVSFADLLTQMHECKAGRKLLLVDACRNEPQSELSKARLEVNLESVTRPQEQDVPEGMVALFSCRAGQKSFEDPDVKHGVFFHHVLKGWAGDADADNDRQLTFRELETYVSRETTKYARLNLRSLQTPQLKGDLSGEWILRSLKPVTTPQKPATPRPEKSFDPSKSGPLAAGTKAGEQWEGNGLKMKFSWCPDGTFQMGFKKDTAPGVSVSLTGFWMGQHEVTQGQWESVMETTIEQQKAKTTDNTLPGRGPNFPMYYVNHTEALDFAKKYTEQERTAGRLPPGWEYRLPTGAQWEYACRAGATTYYSSGDDEKDLEEYAWTRANARGTTHEVGTKKANVWGLRDMSGNVQEWCLDWHGDTLPGGRNPEGADMSSMRLCRGGHWWHDTSYNDLTTRFGRSPNARDAFLGFRVSLVRLGQSDPPKTGMLAPGTKAGEEWEGNGLRMKFCWCPDGEFTMGSPADEKDRFDGQEDQIRVTLTGFWMGKHEVTQTEWQTIMGSTLREQSEKKRINPDDPTVIKGEGPRHPMYYVQHDEATEFARRLTQRERAAGRLPAEWEYRLPTQAQWEYGCRAGTTTRFVSGDDEKNLEQFAWFSTNAEGTTHEVGTKRANEWGLHDLHGNVAEVCRDWFGNKPLGGRDPEVSEPDVSAPYRTTCGGSCHSPGALCRSAGRVWFFSIRSPGVGFRIAAVRLRQ